jgi:hypothetical protein
MQRLLPENTNNTHNKDIHALAGFEPAIPVSEKLQTHGLNRTATIIDL